MIAKRIFIAQTYQNTNYFTKLHTYPGLPHFTKLSLIVSNTIPNQQVSHLLRGSSIEYQNTFFDEEQIITRVIKCNLV